ncbi:sce7725 family protein [Pectobacterium aroidearum]|uniref:sce7725 family protein n=1 Tax=Pectobacterium aroidearum TaxID=1201031 RepID=UPI0030194F35
MYSPYLYARSSELLCLRDLVDNKINVSNLLPILEPVNASLDKLSRCLNVWNGDLIIITNPYQIEYHNNITNLNNLTKYLSSCFSANPRLIKGLMVSSNMSLSFINQWIQSNSTSRIALIYNNPSLSDVEIQNLSSNSSINYHVVLNILNNRMMNGQINHIVPNKLILVSDNFNKLARNADYNGPEFFSDHYKYIGKHLAGVGDYTITGHILEPRGGQPSAVAAHLIYKNLQSSDIWIQHFVSNNTQRGGETIEKMFLDVAGKIYNTVPPRRNEFGINIGTNYYYNDFINKHFPGLPKNKQYQMTHHLCFMMDLLAGRV